MNQADHGLQPERTSLAWRRTGWSMVLPALLCIRGWSHSGSLLYALSAILLLIGAITILRGVWKTRHLFIALFILIPCLLLGCMLLIQLVARLT